MPFSLSAHSLVYAVHGKRLVDEVTMQLFPGKILALVGPNGAGKTTLLRLLAGELEPDQGQVYLDGEPLTARSRRDRAQRLAVLPQHSTLTAALTSLEVVLLGRAPHANGGAGPTDLVVAREALASMDATHLSDRVFPSLSGGEQSRVQAARVLAQIWNPPVDGGSRFLLLDEPTAALDYSHQHDLLSWMRRLTLNGIGVLVILHDLNLAARYADKILVLRGGRPVAEGSPDEVYRNDLLSEVFGMPLSIFHHPQNGQLMVAPTSIHDRLVQPSA